MRCLVRCQEPGKLTDKVPSLVHYISKRANDKLGVIAQYIALTPRERRPVKAQKLASDPCVT